ncbi:MAG: phosphodiester glycosidase family protein [Oscillospiraceae bacterium]|nr:phosphodiester glycosidase family protein [Oscillospiraceae bacterium]
MAKAKAKGLTVGKVIGRFFIVLLTTLILIVFGLLMLMLVIAKGPFPTAQKLFVCTVKETSAVKFLADWFYTDEQIAEYIGTFRSNTTDEVTDPDLVKIAARADENEGGEAVDRPATELVEITGSTYRGKLLKISDPSRVFVGISGAFGNNQEGKRVAEMVQSYGALAGINAGGFADNGGVGNGGVPLEMVISQGELKWGSLGSTYDVIGFDNNNILHVGTMTGQQAIDAGIRDAVCFGPVLIVNGNPCNEDKDLGGGFNPRSAIGQTADGTVLILVIDGRQPGSLGATYDDLISVMLEHGAVNAANLDGGSSSMMIYDGELVTVCSSLYGPRKMPTCWLVAQEN